MTHEATVTSKGRITIPLGIRRLLGLRVGDKIRFESEDGGVRLIPIRTHNAFEKYRGIGNPGVPSGRKGIVRWLRELRGR